MELHHLFINLQTGFIHRDNQQLVNSVVAGYNRHMRTVVILTTYKDSKNEIMDFISATTGVHFENIKYTSCFSGFGYWTSEGDRCDF